MHEKGERGGKLQNWEGGGRGGEHYWVEEKGGEGNEEWEKGEEVVNSEIEEEQEKRR